MSAKPQKVNYFLSLNASRSSSAEHFENTTNEQVVGHNKKLRQCENTTKRESTCALSIKAERKGQRLYKLLRKRRGSSKYLVAPQGSFDLMSDFYYHFSQSSILFGIGSWACPVPMESFINQMN